jgi:class 3 adenylate cyclase
MLSLAHVQGSITRIIPHRATGRADYFGPPVNRAARFLAASAPGQILAERGLVEECMAAWGAADKVGQLVLKVVS